MIKNNFYSTVTSWNILPAPMEFTAYVPNIPITERTAPNAYWLGWISVDNLPQGLHVSEIRLNNDGYDFIDITPQENFDCGYSFRVPPTSTYVSDCPIRISYYRDRISKWSSTAGTANSNNFCFANKANVMAISNGSVELYCSYVIYNSTGETIVARNLGSSSRILATFTHAQWLDFLNGSSFTFSANNATVDISKEDLETGTFYKEMSNGTFIRLFLVGYNFIPNRTTYLSGDAWYDRQSSTPAFMVHINTEYYGDAIVTGCDTTQSTVTSWNSNDPTDALDRVVLRGCKGYFSFDVIATLNYNSSPYVWNETTLIFRDSTNPVNWVQAIFPIGEIEKHYNLNIRSSAIETGQRPFYGYTENSVYAPYVTEDNEFTATRITGNLEDDAFKSKLRSWQYDAAQWEENDYTEDDKPEYDPEPSGDEDQSDGSDWLPNRAFAVDSIDGFATMYGLTGKQLGRFGQYLWAAFWSDDFLNSIGVIFNENLSLNPSEILNYIISVRCYPFSLSGKAGSSGFPDTIYIGRGGEGISLNSGSEILKLTSYAEDIDGGLSVWEGGNTIPAYYGDFRDCESCSRVTVFVPFCGSLELPPSQVVGNKIHLRYCIDFSSGAIQATVSIEGKNNYIAGTLTGTIGATVELSASNLSQVVQKLGGLAGSAAKSIALLAIGSKASAAAETGEELVTATDLMAKGGESAVSTLTSVADMGVVPAASFGTTAGFSSFQVTTPMIRVEYRHYELPSNYAHVYGYACNKTIALSDLEGKGFTVCKNVDLSGIPATQDELTAIESLLTSGVYF